MDKNNATHRSLKDVVKDCCKGMGNYANKLNEFCDKEQEYLLKNIVISLFCGLPMVAVGIPFAILGFYGDVMIKIGFSLMSLVFLAEIGFDAVKMYIAGKKERIEYYVLIAISSTLVLVAYWGFYRLLDYIRYGG